MGETPFDAAVNAVERQSPSEGLRAVAALRGRLDELEALHVENAVRAGFSWREIAEMLGVTKQAAHKKHARRVNEALRASPRAHARRRVIVTGRARQSVRFARGEAVALGEGSVRPEHLLLGLLRDVDGLAARTLSAAGVTLDEARRHVERLRPEGVFTLASDAGAEEALPISPEARIALEQSLREAVRRGDAYLGVEHLLLALVHDHGGPGARLLAGLGVDPGAVERLLDEAARAAK